MIKKKYLQVICKACNGEGKLEGNEAFDLKANEDIYLYMYLQGICFGCFGKGTQTVLEVEENDS